MKQFLNINNYDLAERTAKFGENIIVFCRTISQDVINRPIISQLIRSATSIGANYMEATAASSKKDFTNKIFICKKETQETKHWLRMIAKCVPEETNRIKELWLECHEFNLIFQKITSTIRNKSEH